MKVIGNIIWFVVVGLLSFIIWTLVGIFWCITIIGIPFGVQCIKIGCFSVFPFGKTIKTNFDKHPIANIIYYILWLGDCYRYVFASIIYVSLLLVFLFENNVLN